MSLEVTVPSRRLALRPRSDVVGELIGAFESDTAAVFLRTAPIRESFTMYVFVTMLVVGLLLASICKLDRVVTSVAGIVMATSGALYVSAYNSAVIQSVNVKVGEVVKKGQALATLDPTFTQADLLQVQEHLASDQATVAREEAELAGRPYQFSATDRYQSNQGAIWLQRQAQYHSQLASFDAQIGSTEAQMAQAQSDADKYTQRLKLASNAEDVYEPLLDKGYVSKLQVMQATDVRTEMSRLLADAQNQISQYRETANSLRQQRQFFIKKWFADTATQLVLDRNDLLLTIDNRDKAQKLQDLTSLASPADAIVLQIGKLSPGSVAAGNGQDSLSPATSPLFTLAPLDAPLVAEINVSTSDIGFIAVGNVVNLKLDSYSFVLYGMAEGVVKSISEGSFSTDANNTPVAPYFKVRVKVTGMHMHDVPRDFRLIPGMTLVGDIIVGQRTIMSYLTETLLRQGSEAMREPQ